MAPENSPTVGSPQANSINGHEYHAVADLQYACIFPLEARRDCTLVAEDKGCDCKQSELSDVNRVAYNKPLCQPPGTANTGTTQYFAKAYPGLRQLQVLKDYGPNSIVASICPKHMGGDIEDPSYGYYPALDAFYDRLKDTTHSRCFPRPLSVDPATGLVNCAAVEATSESAGCDCAARPGRTSEPLSESSSDPRTQKLVGAFRDGLKNNLGVCDKPGKPDCSSFCLCEIQQLGKDAQGLCSVASASSVCQPSSQETPAAGFCYVDGTSPAVRDCAESEKQKILFVGPGTPWKGATTFMACAIQKSAGM
jgi:hypothetical protein